MSIRIDKEFESLIPPLPDDEFKQLEENCVRDGIRDPLVLWSVPNGDDILIDGHNRWKIAAQHAGMPFETVHMEFDNRDQVIAWICSNQLGRRNLHPLDKEKLMSTRRAALEADAKKRQAVYHGNQYQKSGLVEKLPEVHKERTRDIIGKEIGVSGRQVDKLHRINEMASEPVKKAVRKGDMSVDKAYLSTFPKREDPVKAAKREHLEYELSKGDIVDIKEARKDKQNQAIISGAMVQEVMKLLSTIQKFSLYYNAKDLSVLRTELDDANKTHMKGIIKNCHMTLDGIARAIDGGKHGKI